MTRDKSRDALLAIGAVLLLLNSSPSVAVDYRAAEYAIASGAYEHAERQLRNAAQQGDDRAQLLMGKIYRAPRFAKCNVSVSTNWYLKSAAAGNESAQLYLGHLFRVGRYAPRDEKLAYQYYRAAAEQGNTTAQGWVGEFLFDGRGIEKDRAESLQWIQSAANKGDSLAITRLAKLHLDGVLIKKNAAHAAQLLRSVNRVPGIGNEAAFLLGQLLAAGVGTQKNPREAFKTMSFAAAWGHAGAMREMARFNRQGIGVTPSESRAEEWEQRASNTEIAVRNARQRGKRIVDPCPGGPGAKLDLEELHRVLENLRKSRK